MQLVILGEDALTFNDDKHIIAVGWFKKLFGIGVEQPQVEQQSGLKQVEDVVFPRKERAGNKNIKHMA